MFSLEAKNRSIEDTGIEERAYKWTMLFGHAKCGLPSVEARVISKKTCHAFSQGTQLGSALNQIGLAGMPFKAGNSIQHTIVHVVKARVCAPSERACAPPSPSPAAPSAAQAPMLLSVPPPSQQSRFPSLCTTPRAESQSPENKVLSSTQISWRQT